METTKAVGGKRLKGRKMHSHPPPTTTQLLSCIPSGSLDFDICISGPWLGFHSGTEQRAVTADTGGFLLVISLAVISDISLCNLPGLESALQSLSLGAHRLCLWPGDPSAAGRLGLEPVYKACSYFCFVLAKKGEVLPAVCLECYLLGTFLWLFFVALHRPEQRVIDLQMPGLAVCLLRGATFSVRRRLAPVSLWSFLPTCLPSTSAPSVLPSFLPPSFSE